MLDEIAGKLGDLSVDENGVLDKKVKASAILFNEKEVKAKFQAVAEKMLTGTISKFGKRGFKEGQSAKTKS
jgi:hypothetical protein